MLGKSSRRKARMGKRLDRQDGSSAIPDNQRMKVWWAQPPPRPRKPLIPRVGAAYTTTQMVSSFSNSTSVGTSGGQSYIAQTAPTALLGQIAFDIGDLAQLTSFSALFDQYRIDRVRVRIQSRNNAVNLGNVASPNNGLPTMYVVIDRDDATAPASIPALQEYDNCIEANGTQSVDIDFVPSITPAVFATGSFSGYEVSPSSRHWIDMANTSVPCYGVKFGVTPLVTSTTSDWIWDVYAWYTISFKNTR